MSMQEKYANPEGRGCVKYLPDGSQVLTGGPDGDVNVFSSDSKNESKIEPLNNECSLCIELIILFTIR